jgi:Domain of unknown function (DUF4232)
MGVDARRHRDVDLGRDVRRGRVSRPLRRASLTRRGLLLLLTAAALAVPARTAASPPRVIPWLDQRPVRASAHPPLAPPCRAGELRAQLFLQGATGSLAGGVNLMNVGSTPCSLLGRPTVSFTGAAAASVQLTVNKMARSPAPPDVLADPRGSLRALAPGKSASVSLWWSNWCGPGSTPTGSPGAVPDGLELVFAGWTSLVVPLGQAPRCDAPQYPSSLTVGPFTPTPRHLPASSRLPLEAAIVGARPVQVKPGLRAFRAHRGELFHFEVAVSNTGRKAFRFSGSSCPVYIEQIVPGPAQVFVLNCRPAGTIAPGGTVVFEMQLRVPLRAPLRNTALSWELAPKTAEAPFAGAALWVTR